MGLLNFEAGGIGGILAGDIRLLGLETGKAGLSIGVVDFRKPWP